MSKQNGRRCSICGDPDKKQWVAERHLEGFSASKMESLSRASESVKVMKRETIKKHLGLCLGSTTTGQTVVDAANSMVKSGADKAEDVATLVQEEVVRKLRDGEARVTVQHGLQAQQLLDRREENKKDRKLAITLARMLHTPSPPQSAIQARPADEVVIEGDVVDVTPTDA